MRIGIVGNIPKPFGGVATTCLQQAQQLIAAGNEVSFYDRDRHPEKFPPPGLKKYVVTRTRKIPVLLKLMFDIPRRWLTNQSFRTFLNRWVRDSQRYHLFTQYPATALRMLLRSIEMIWAFEEQKVEVIHAHRALHDAWAAQLLAQYYFQCPFVVTMYTSEFTMPENQPWRQMVLDICNRADAVVCISQYARDCMLKGGAVPKFEVINYLGVEPVHFADPPVEKIKAVRERFGMNDGCPIILYVGWLVERKGPQVLIEALPNITQLPWKAVFVGPDRGMKDVLSDRAKEMDLQDRVVVSDAIPYDEIPALYNLADIFVFPTLSLDEGFGLVALEAMAHGLPVIASRTGAIPEVVSDKSTGLFFTSGDSNELASRLIEILGDANLRSQMGVAARAHAREFTWEDNCSRLMQTYQDAIRRHARPI